MIISEYSDKLTINMISKTADVPCGESFHVEENWEVTPSSTQKGASDLLCTGYAVFSKSVFLI
jgi:hypothetical protein